jgi:hypothetical protein
LAAESGVSSGFGFLNMSLIRKSPTFKKGDLIRLKDAAEIICCDAESIRTGRIGNFTLIRLNDSKTSPIVVKKAEVDKFLAERIARAEGF